MADFSRTNGDLATAVKVEIVTMDRHKMNVVIRSYEWRFKFVPLLLTDDGRMDGRTDGRRTTDRRVGDSIGSLHLSACEPMKK